MRVALLPDTIFLPDRARLAINCLTGCLNPTKDQLPFCLTDLTGSPPRMMHTQFDFSDHAARVVDALLLAQALCGSEEGVAQLDALERMFFTGFGDDGLHYTPDNPWSFHHANMHYQRSVLNGLLSLCLARRSARARDQLVSLTKALNEISIKREDFAYFPSVERFPDGWPRGDWGILSFGVDPANTNGRLLFGLTRAWELTGEDAAREIAEAYARHVMHHSSAYDPDGGFATGLEFREGHFHSRAVTMLGVIRYAYGTGDTEALAWGQKVFDKACTYGTRFGWFPERLVESRAHGCETCAIVDMMEAAIWLAKSGQPQYWGVAERFLRNHLLESQLTSIDGLEDSAGTGRDDEWESTVRVARRSIGGFAGWSQPNDLFSKVMHEWDLYTCCSAQGVRGLFNAWTNAVVATDDGISVNLLINHLSKHAVIRSWLPQEGRIEIVPTVAGDVRVRIPDGTDTMVVTVDGAPVTAVREPSEFLCVAGAPAGATIQCQFAVPEWTSRETILDTEYTADWRGDTVMTVSPGGTRLPLYQRDVSPVAMVEKSAPDIGFTM
ncbi:MAG: glycoside hydrolase family 127 protein [Rhodospirillaceae bacterium]|nr:glycoside hydrolase family 127 protein [Rhodospirillaceae bacterium]